MQEWVGRVRVVSLGSRKAGAGGGMEGDETTGGDREKEDISHNILFIFPIILYIFNTKYLNILNNGLGPGIWVLYYFSSLLFMFLLQIMIFKII